MEYLLYNIMTVLSQVINPTYFAGVIRDFLGFNDRLLVDIVVSDFFGYLIYFAALIFAFVFIIRLFVGFLIKFWRLFTE